jgi:hypothetical protein
VGRDCSVGTATRYGLDGPGSNPGGGGGEIFRTRPDQPRALSSLLYDGYRVSFPGVKRSGHGVNHSPSSSAEVKERVELYIYSPLGLHGLFTFTFTSSLPSQCLLPTACCIVTFEVVLNLWHPCIRHIPLLQIGQTGSAVHHASYSIHTQGRFHEVEATAAWTSSHTSK